MRNKVVPALADAFRIAFFRRLPEDRPTTGWVRILAAALLAFVPPLVYSLVAIGSEGTIAWNNLPDGALVVFLVFVGAIALGTLSGRTDAVPTFLLAGLLAWFAIDAICFAIFGALYYAKGERAAGAFPYAGLSSLWIAAAMLRFAHARAVNAARGFWMFLAAGLFVALPLWHVSHTSSIWDYDHNPTTTDPATEAKVAARMAGASEEALYAQPLLLQRELAAVEPGRKGIVDVYFIGMAGYGAQDVFMREVDSVAALMRERFDAQGRTVRLVNNPKTSLGSPIASVTSLRAALRRVAAVMDIEEDVLVLFLTSHGTQTHRFAIELWPFRFNELTPAVLRQALDESGIRNRVVVVSACYSGGFIEPLKSDDTLVMSASSADRNSFGCSNEAQWTYFGKAYFDEALRKTHSFTAAFEMAKLSVEQREKEDKFEPSNPRIAVGKSIAPVLAALERDLAAGKRNAAPKAHVRDEFDRYIDVVFTRSSQEQRELCLTHMQATGPAAQVERSPDYFGGMNKSSSQWPQLEAAWLRYSQAFCTQANDPRMLREGYERHVRRVMGPEDVAAALRFLQTPAGKAWLAKDEDVSRQHTLELGRATLRIAEADYNKFMAEMEKLTAEYRAQARK